MARYAGNVFDRSGTAAASFSLNGKAGQARFAAPLKRESLKVDEAGTNTLEVRNEGHGPLYARLVQEGIPPLGKETEAAEGILLTVRYADLQGKELDVGTLDQGTDFVAVCEVRHTGMRSHYEQLALTSLFPSGWEIRNTRMDAVAEPPDGAASAQEKAEERAFRYQDFRDDRVHTYFDLRRGHRRVYRFHLNAAYVGRFHLPQSKVEAMYDAAIQSRTKGRTVVVRAGEPKAGDPNAPSTLKKKRADGDGGDGEESE
jgi:uncharacterized protein YfaS (alpha-2-macroglobulin family)